MPDPVSIGGTFTWTQTVNGFKCGGTPILAWSGIKTLYTETTEDSLIALDHPFSQASILSDHSSEGADIIRLIALESTGNLNEYKVLDYFQTTDNMTTLAGCTLSINVPTGFSYLMVQSTTEAEAFDNLTLTGPVPEPATMASLAVLLVPVVRRRRRRAK